MRHNTRGQLLEVWSLISSVYGGLQPGTSDPDNLHSALAAGFSQLIGSSPFLVRFITFGGNTPY